jgi:hypothetical protein
MMTISTEGRGMQPTGNSSYGITGIWELVTEGLFPVVASGKFVSCSCKSLMFELFKG